MTQHEIPLKRLVSRLYSLYKWAYVKCYQKKIVHFITQYDEYILIKE